MAQSRARTDMPLDRNESYWLIDENLLEACKQFDISVLSTYPDYDELKIKIAKYAGVTPEEICLTPGSDAVIETIARVFVGKEGKALLPVPTFYGYEAILGRVGADMIPVTYTEEGGEFQFPHEEFRREIKSEEIKAAFLCSPNNPLGCTLGETQTKEVIDAVPSSALLVSDEAYFEYSGYTLLPYLESRENLIIVRTLSKGFGIPGARIGYCIAKPDIIKQIEKELLPWPIAHTSFFVANTLLDREDQVRKRRELVIQQRARFIEALQQHKDIQVYPSETNFVLIRTPRAEELVKVFAENSIRVVLGEHMTQFPVAKGLLHSTIRMAIPSPEDQDTVDNLLQIYFTK